MLRRVLTGGVFAALAFVPVSASAQQHVAQTRGGETTVAKQIGGDRANPLLLQADDLVYDNRNNRVVARGNVEIYYNDYTLLANEVVYDRQANTLTAVGNVRLKEPDGALVNADRLTLKDDFRDGFIKSLKVVTQDDARIAASNAYRKDGDKTVFENGVFTSCKPCLEHPENAPIWRVKATKITTDRSEHVTYYENSQFEFFGIPIAWIPYFYMPDPAAKHTSGVLMPQYKHSTQLGYTVAVPLYYSPSPSYDLTLTPEFTTRAGYLGQAEWRQKLWDGAYRINLAGAYNDNSDNFTGDRKLRGSVQTAGDFAVGSLWHFGWNATIESDDTFRRFYKLDSIYATDRVSQVYLTGQGERNFFNMSAYEFGNLTGSKYRDDKGISRRRVNAQAYPSADYNYVHEVPVLGGEFSFDINALALTVNNSDTLDGDPFNNGYRRRDSDHLVTQTQWRRTVTDGLGQNYTPFFQARGDIYHTSQFRDLTLNDQGPDDTFTREMVVGGLDYRYPFVSQTEDASHVVEPVAQIIARPNVAYNRKVFNDDSRSLVFDDTLLFDINKFSGYDRIETGTRSNVGLQYTMQSYNGVSVRVVGGESFQIAGPNSFDPSSGLDRDRSDYVLGGYFDLRNMLRLTSQVRLDEKDFSVARQDYSVQTKLGFFQAAASYVAVEQTPTTGNFFRRQELAGFAAVRLNEDWTVFGDLRYNLEDEKFIRNAVGVQYSDECFTYSVTYAETFIQDGDIKPDTTVMMRVGLKYLGQQTVSDSIGDLSPEAAVFK